MRLFLAVGLALVVCLGAAFRPGDNLPGREVGAAESCRVVGGAQTCTTVTCGSTYPCNSGTCYASGVGQTCAACCVVAAACTGG